MYGWSPGTTTESMPSPGSPNFPLTNGYHLPQGPDWPAWATKDPDSPAMLQSAANTQYPVASPVVNPLDLARDINDVPFGIGGYEDLHSPRLESLFALQEPAPVVAKSRKISATAAAPTKTEAHEPLSQSASDQARYPSRKRKSDASAASSSTASSSSSTWPSSPRTTTRQSPSASASGPKKTAHNMIEKRYRNNLNDKISALRDAVPSLRAAARRLEQGPNSDGSSVDADDDAGPDVLAPVQKLNKATILSKAAEYIAYLEKQNRKLGEENEKLRKGMSE